MGTFGVIKSVQNSNDGQKPLSDNEQRRMERNQDAIKRRQGIKAVGFRAPNSGSPAVEREAEPDGGSEPQEIIEQKEFIKPELGIGLNKEVLHSLAERFPDHREMFERFSHLPSIKFERGKVNFIFGPNGSGKSTLANAIFLAAKVALTAQRKLSESPGINLRRGEEEPKLNTEQAHKDATEQILHPHRSAKYEVAELVSMAAAPRLVEEGALTISQFQAREGYGGADQDVESDTAIVCRIAIQDMLGEARSKEEDYMSETRHETRLDAASDKIVPIREFSGIQSSYADSGASARQMIEVELKRQFEDINPGSIVIMDEAAFGLSPKRQEGYIKMLEQFAREKELIIIAPENSGYAFDSASTRVDLETPERGLHISETRDSESRAGVAMLQSKEALQEATMEFGIDQEKIRQLAETNPKFRPMLESFAKLPSSFAFGPGKTEIFADNGGGKTTMLGILYLLMEIERRINQSMENRGHAQEREILRKEHIEDLVKNPYQTGDKLFMESLGFARELIMTGAITLKNTPIFSQHQDSPIDGMGAPIKWINLLDVSGDIKRDNFGIIGYSESKDVSGIADEIKKMRPDRVHGSTRQTAETLLIQTLQHMPEGGFLFVDEIDGGISPGRQLRISDQVHKLSKEKKITIVATSNSYEGFKYRLTPSLDLSTPEEGVTPATYKLAESA